MNIRIKGLFLCTSVCLLGAGLVGHAQAGQYLESGIQAKLTRAKALQRLSVPANENDGDAMSILRNRLSGDSQTPCGAIDLGNVENATVFERAGATTVIIDGDVINANNNC